MTEKINQPRPYDVVLGNQVSTPVGAVVLGGIQGVKSRLASEFVEVRIAALQEAMNYGKTGLDLAIAALKNEFWQVRQVAVFLLEQSGETKAKEALREFNNNTNRYETFVNSGKLGRELDVDNLMHALENDTNVATIKLVDYALSLVNNPVGKNQIKHYLFNGTTMQRNYAALYFKRLKQKDILAEAVKQGCIDRVQAFSK